MGFSEEMIQKVWKKGRVVSNNDPDLWRKDQCGAWIKRSQYGNRESSFGWEIDHIRPKARGGSDSNRNLQPLHWKENREKGDD